MSELGLALALVGAYLTPVFAGLVGLRVYAERRNSSFTIDGNEEVPIVALALWPVSLLIVAFLLVVNTLFVLAPAAVAKRLAPRRASLPPVQLQQPDLGPHRTPRCGACGKPCDDESAA